MSDVARAFEAQGWWIVSRASGLLALALVTVSVLIGLTLAGKPTRDAVLLRRLRPLHEQTALAGLVAIVIHGIALLCDPWLDVGIVSVAVPFTLHYATAFTGLGVIAAYLAFLLGLTYYVRNRIGARLWRTAHRATVVVYLLGVVHAFGAGTDSGSIWFLAWVVLTGIPILLLFAYRMEAAARLKRRLGGEDAQDLPGQVEYEDSLIVR